MIDVIVPVYKVEKYLDRCVRSIINQTYGSFQLILVDDGSPDRCGAMCDQYGDMDKRVHVIHKNNGGLSSARNAGLKASTSEYVTFVDSDDWLSPIFLETLLRIAQKCNSDITEAGFCKAFDETDRYKGAAEQIQTMDREQAMKRLFRCQREPVTYYAWGRLYRRTAIGSILFPEGKLFEDLYFNYFVLKNVSCVSVTAEVLYFYYMNPEGITRGYFTQQNLQILEIWKSIMEDCRLNEPKFYEYAVINYERAYLGLLSKCCRFGMDSRITDQKKIKDYLQEELRNYRGDLLKWNMPISRKLLTVLLGANYQIAEWSVKVLKKFHVIG